MGGGDLWDMALYMCLTYRRDWVCLSSLQDCPLSLFLGIQVIYNPIHYSPEIFPLGNLQGQKAQD